MIKTSKVIEVIVNETPDGDVYFTKSGTYIGTVAPHLRLQETPFVGNVPLEVQSGVVTPMTPVQVKREQERSFDTSLKSVINNREPTEV